MKERLRDLWKRILLRQIHYRDSHKKLDALYRIADPWSMESDEEQFRFRETNRLIEASIGRVDTLLEIGCGEGHQSVKLMQICSQLYGLDVSPRAVERAKQRCPQGVFESGDIFDCKLLDDVGLFDLVVACEVLYYVKDIPATIARLSSLARRCFVTYYEGPSVQLDPYLKAIPGVQTGQLQYKSTVWKAYWWQNNHDVSYRG